MENTYLIINDNETKSLLSDSGFEFCDSKMETSYWVVYFKTKQYWIANNVEIKTTQNITYFNLVELLKRQNKMENTYLILNDKQTQNLLEDSGFEYTEKNHETTTYLIVNFIKKQFWFANKNEINIIPNITYVQLVEFILTQDQKNKKENKMENYPLPKPQRSFIIAQSEEVSNLLNSCGFEFKINVNKVGIGHFILDLDAKTYWISKHVETCMAITVYQLKKLLKENSLSTFAKLLIKHDELSQIEVDQPQPKKDFIKRDKILGVATLYSCEIENKSSTNKEDIFVIADSIVECEEKVKQFISDTQLIGYEINSYVILAESYINTLKVKLII